MNYEIWFGALRQELKGLNQSDIDEIVAYHQEAYSDRIEAGKTQEEAIQELGDPKVVAKKYLDDQSWVGINNIAKKVYNKNAIMLVVLLVFASPFILAFASAGFGLSIGLLVTAASLVFVGFVLIFVVAISGFAIGIVGIYSLLMGIITMSTDSGVGLALLGTGIGCIGLSIVLCVAFETVFKLSIKFAKWGINKLNNGIKAFVSWLTKLLHGSKNRREGV